VSLTISNVGLVSFDDQPPQNLFLIGTISMTESKSFTSIPEEDYLAILKIINHFNQCETRQQLKAVIQTFLLPLVDAQAAIYGNIDPDFYNFALVDTVNISEREQRQVMDFVPYDTLFEAAANQGRLVMGMDVDMPRDYILKDYESFFENNPDYDARQKNYFDKFKAGIVMRDPLDPNLGVGMHRHIDKVVSQRDVRVMELLAPHVLHAMKVIVLREELSKYQSLTEVLAGVATPMAIFRENYKVSFCNEGFVDLLNVKQGEPLPQGLTQVLEKEISKYNPPIDIEDSKLQIPFYPLGDVWYRLNITRLDNQVPQEGDLWLLRLKPAVEPYSNLNRKMQAAGLTGREMEICMLIRSGYDNKEISSRLFISYHTTKNHVRSIHAKMKVKTRTQLLSYLNDGKAGDLS